MSLQAGHDQRLDEIRDRFAHAVGQWIGCDWPTEFGRRRLDLRDLRADHAVLMARATAGTEAEAWWEASRWLARVETEALEAEAEARQAIAKAEAGSWLEALSHARAACDMEARYHSQLIWQPLRESVESAFRKSGRPS